ncbi:MAG: PA2779 family protein [Pseudomonadota bacterium]
MKLFYKLISQILIASMILLPFSAQAGVIGTDQAVASAQDLANRAKVNDFLSRGDVIKKFEALGLNAATAQERVNAMTQEEINRIAGKIDTLPAGAMSNWWVGATVVVIALLLWWAYMK